MERRKFERYRALLGGRIFYNNGQSSLDCILRDISEGGSRIKVENSIAVPEKFHLVLNDGRNFDCQVRWRKVGLLGVSFD